MVKRSQHTSSNVISKRMNNRGEGFKGKCGTHLGVSPKFGFQEKPEFLFSCCCHCLRLLHILVLGRVTAEKMTDSLVARTLWELEEHKGNGLCDYKLHYNASLEFVKNEDRNFVLYCTIVQTRD